VSGTTFVTGRLANQSRGLVLGTWYLKPVLMSPCVGLCLAVQSDSHPLRYAPYGSQKLLYSFECRNSTPPDANEVSADSVMPFNFG
jgi:hypothetical protein